MSFSESALVANSNPKKYFCQIVYHYSDKCIIVTEIHRRRELLRRNRSCFNCLKRKNCRKQIKYFKCKTEGHYTTLCNPLQKQIQSYVTDDNSKEDPSANLVKHFDIATTSKCHSNQ